LDDVEQGTVMREDIWISGVSPMPPITHLVDNLERDVSPAEDIEP
jgi:hypothetical protein